jgi:hypothetical protein
MLEDVQQQVKAAKSNADLLKAIDVVRLYPGTLSSDNTLQIILIIAGTLLMVILFSRMGPNPSMGEALLFFGGAGLFFAGFCVMLGRSGNFQNISSEIIECSSYFTNGFGRLDFDSEQGLKILQKEFSDFSQGVRQKVLIALSGRYVGRVHALQCQIFKIRYCKNNYDSSDDKQGKDYEDRTSIVIDFPWVRNVLASTGSVSRVRFPVAWETVSSEFSSRFFLAGKDQLECARFATPATLQLLLEMADKFTRLNLEFSAVGRLSMSFSTDILQNSVKGINLMQRDAFKTLVEHGVELPLLQEALLMVHKLAELHDNNFSLIEG